MKKNDAWWTEGDPLWGGETFVAEKDKKSLEIRKGDVFRIEKKGRAIRLIPHPDNKGAWNVHHDRKHPIILRARKSRKRSFRRIFALHVQLPQFEQPKTFFLAETANHEIALRFDDPNGGKVNGGIASIRR